MHAPHKAASMLLMGLGMGLLVATGFALRQNRMDLTRSDIGLVLPLIAITCFLLAYLTSSGRGPLSRLFPNETLEELSDRIQTIFREDTKYERVNNAWAELEANVLTSELNEGEE